MFRIVCLLPYLLLNSCMARNKLNLLERKIYGMETSIQQDLTLLRQNVESNTNELEKIVRILNNTIVDVKESVINGYSIADTTQTMVSSTEVEKDIKEFQSESQRVKRAFAHEKQYLREMQAHQDAELAKRLDIIQTELEKKLMNIGEELIKAISQTVGTMKMEVEETVGTLKMEVNKTLNNFDKTINDSVEKMLQSELNTTKRLEELTVQVNSLKTEQIISLNILNNVSNSLIVLKDFDTMQNKLSMLENRAAVSTEGDEKVIDYLHALGRLSVYGVFSTVNVRLVNGSSHNGRVEIYYNGRWGTVCDDAFDDLDARVVCRSLGYSSGVAKTEAYYGAGSGSIWLDNVKCTGSEPSIFACPAKPIGVENCGHYEDAGVVCS